MIRQTGAHAYRTGVASAWNMDIKKPWIDFRPIDSFTPSEIIEEMFIPRGDFWDRSWMFCDHVGSLVNIVALGFALFRRTGDAVAFDAVMKTWILDSETGEARRSEAEKPQPQQPPLFYQLSHTLLLQQARFGAAGSSELRRTGRAKYWRDDDRQVSGDERRLEPRDG